MISKRISFIIKGNQNLKYVILKFKNELIDWIGRATKNPTQLVRSGFIATLIAFVVFTAHIAFIYFETAREIVYYDGFGPETLEKGGGNELLLQGSQLHKSEYIVVNSADFVSKKPTEKLTVKAQISTNTTRIPITAYSSTPDQTYGDPFITASGTRVRDGVVAANFLPIGTKVRMPNLFGDKVFVVEDRMSSRYRKHLDVWMPSRQQAKTFGVKMAYIEVVD